MQNKPYIIIGGGGHTRVLIGMLKCANATIRGIVTRDEALLGTEIHGVPVLGHEDDLKADAAEVTLVNGVGNVVSREGTGLEIRAGIYARYHALGYSFLPIISDAAILQPDITMGDGVHVMPGAIIQPGVMIGENVIINTRASIDHDVVIAPHSHIAPGAVICGHASIGEQTHIGAGAVVIQGIHIGNHAVIGAGAIVTRHVPDYAVVRPSASEQMKATPKA